MKKKLLVKVVCLGLLVALTCGLLAGCSIKPTDYVRPTFTSPNAMQGATIVKESLKKGEKADAKNLISDDSKAWTPSFLDGKSANEDDNTLSSTVEIQLKTMSTFNTALIEEVGNEVQYFRLQAWVNDSWKTIYKSEKIQNLRLCSFDAVTTDKVRLSIDKFRGKGAKIKAMSLYNEQKRAADDFNVTVYQRLDGDSSPTKVLTQKENESTEKYNNRVNTYARYYDVYNTVLVFAAVSWKNGEMAFNLEGGEDAFAKELAALKILISKRTKQDRKVNIICTSLADGLGGDHGGVNVFMAANWMKVADQSVEFMKKYDLDGLDIDWEYPQSGKDWKCFDNFIKRLDEGMERVKPGSILSGALSAWGLKMSTETLQRFDQIQFMAYDGRDEDGYQSSLEQAQYGLVDFLNNGADIKKINIGIAAYGRPLNGAAYWASWRDDVKGDDLYFNNLLYNVECGGQIFDSTFCSPALAGDKTAYALMSGVGGVMVFRLNCDKTMDDPNAVACGIENVLKRYLLNY